MCSSSTIVHDPAEIQKAALHKETQYWYRDDSITAGQASQIVKQRLSNLGPQKIIHITEVAKRVKTSEDAAVALDVAQQYALRRANRQQHDGIHPHTSYLILKSITKVGADKAVEVLKKAPELKLTFGPRAFRDIIVKASKEGDLAAMRSAFQLLQAAGIQPNRDLGYCLVRASFDNKRPDLAVAYAREFEVNGVGLRPAMKDQVQKVEQELQQKKAAARDARAAKAATAENAGQAEGRVEAGDSSPDDGQSADGPETEEQPPEK
ncbi:g4787 [Coccomyxa viridis]|uniref:G4787 protein n=1 Tax=Coccomyxa viridis TaxID=1274662 RepID=A0ABP1FR54_9CHLO